MSGRLRVVATPLGNLDDLSPRARTALTEADAIAAEDTRRTGRLLELLGISSPPPLLSYYAPREREKVSSILQRLESGQTIVLVSDGGTPAVSDPGAVLLCEAHERGIVVEPIPGPSAVTTALSVSSLASSGFVFEGFLPSKGAARRARLEGFLGEERAIVLFESPHRIGKLLPEMVEIFGAERRATIVREVTKIHEQVLEGSISVLAERFGEGAKGEFTLVLEGGVAKRPNLAQIEVSELLQALLAEGLTESRAARVAAHLTGRSRSRLLEGIAELTQKPDGLPTRKD